MSRRISPHKTVEGLAFPDYIHLEKVAGIKHFSSKEKKGRTRDYLLPLLIFVLSFVLLTKLISLQLFKGAYYRDLSDSNRIRTTVVHAPRGIIFDRNNIPLVFNTPGFREVVDNKTRLLEREEVLSLIASGKTNLEVDSLREYPLSENMAHVIGFIGQISKEELALPKFSSYRIDDLVGKTGIEQKYESLLKGIDGKQLVEVDALGKTVRKLGETDPIPGKDIKLTLDAKLQQASFLAMKDVKKGAVIVSTPKGEVLTMISKPSFNPNFFTFGTNYKGSFREYKSILEILEDKENQPLLNRAISGLYPPGSTFKLITAASGLANNIIDENFEVNDTGVLQIGAFSFSNWYFTQYGKTEGLVNVVKALKRSNDVFFYKLAEKVGVEDLSAMARKFGLGEKLGIDLEGEGKGVVPSNEWKKKVIGEQWYLGDTYHYGIGQGYLLVTPLQVNAWTQAIANGGTLYKPHLLQNSEFRIQNSELLSEKSLSLIKEGMVESCSPGGVAWPLFEFRIKNSELRIDGENFLEVPQATTSADFKDYRQVIIACKTGTAQHGGEQTLPHAWITLFAPAYNPQIVVTVLAESSGEGSNVAAPIAKKILEEWFTR